LTTSAPWLHNIPITYVPVSTIFLTRLERKPLLCSKTKKGWY
jgi:hypothetical protein